MNIKKIAIKTLVFIRDIYPNTIEWAGNTWDWLSVAFSNWDSQIYELKDQAIYMFYKIIEFGYIVLDVIRKIIDAISEIINEILKGIR